MDKVRIGVFGARRGGSYISLFLKMPETVEVVAICDAEYVEIKTETKYPGIPCFKDFETFMKYGQENGMNAVFLANYFYDHAPYAIKCMDAGMDVISECTAAGTLKDCVELVEAVERTGKKYMLAENYPFSASNLEMNKFAKSGQMGALLYAEGEYNHSGPVKDLINLCASSPYHWRKYLPRTYYLTHAMGPLMYASDSMPKYVSAMSVPSPMLHEQLEGIRYNLDGTAIIMCQMSNGMVARFTGCTAMASDYTRYRIVGEKASMEIKGMSNGKVRKYWHSFTKPEGEPQDMEYTVSQKDFGENGIKAANAGHGGGDCWVALNMVEYFLHGTDPFFDVYKSVAMSATAILAWRSALHHGENFRIPDFHDMKDREQYRTDDLTPFPDDNGNGKTLPSCMPY